MKHLRTPYGLSLGVPTAMCGGPVESQLKSWPCARTSAAPGRFGEKRKFEEKSLLTERCGPDDTAQANVLRGGQRARESQVPASRRLSPGGHAFPPGGNHTEDWPSTLVFRPTAPHAKSRVKFCP